MRGGFRAAALLTFVLLCAFTCNGSSSQTGNNTPGTPTTAGTETTPPSNPTGTATAPPTSAPTSAPTSSPTSTPTGAPLAITGLPFHNGEVGVGYLAVSLAASGGAPPYTWSISAGSFPPGLNVSSGGTVSGTNTAAGNFSFTVKVTDTAAGTAFGSASMHVFTALSVTQPCASTCSVEEGCTICGSFGSVGGGLPPYSYSITADSRPPGMGVSGLNLTGAFPPPGPFGAYSLTVQVTDSQFGATQTVNASWFVFGHITITQTSFSCGFSPSSCTLQIPYSGGTPGGNPTITVVLIGSVTSFVGTPPPPTIQYPGPPPTGGPPSCFNPTTSVPKGLPPGATIAYGGGVITLNIPNPNAAGYCFYQAKVTFELVDQSPCGPGNCISNTATIDISI